jgi:hypothetical protein
MVDLGDADAEGEAFGPSLRVTPRGRFYLLGAYQGKQDEASRFVDNQLLRVGAAACVGHVLALAPFIEISAISGGLDVIVTPQSMSLALSAGVDADVIRARLEALAPLPDPISRQLVQASTVIGRAELVNTQGFLWVEDPEIRELLRTRRQSSDLFIDPSPPAGLLIAPGVDLDRLARRCRALGVELIVDGEVYRARSMAPTGRSGAWRLDSSSSQSGAKAPGSARRSRRSSTSIPARRAD